MSYVKWMPPGSPQLQAGKVRELDYRLSRLERQRAGMLQRIAVKNATEYRAVSNGSTYIWDAGAAPSVTANIEVPSDKSWVLFGASWEAVTVRSVVAGPDNVNPRLYYDGTLMTNQFNYPLSEILMTNQTTKNYAWKWPTQAHRRINLWSLNLAAGPHTLKAEVGATLSASANNGTELFVRNIAIRGYVHA